GGRRRVGTRGARDRARRADRSLPGGRPPGARERGAGVGGAGRPGARRERRAPRPRGERPARCGAWRGYARARGRLRAAAGQPPASVARLARRQAPRRRRGLPEPPRRREPQRAREDAVSLYFETVVLNRARDPAPLSLPQVALLRD